MRIGIDVGGTFTDIVVFDEKKRDFLSLKVPSTPNNPELGALEGMKKIFNMAGREGKDVNFFSHGTTVVTNAILEGRLAKTALITTEGFRDVLEIGRQRRPQQYNFFAEKPKPIVPRSLRYTVRERMGSRGEVIIPLNKIDLEEIILNLKKEKVESVAICFLFSFLNPSHEKEVSEIIRERLPDLYVFNSWEVLPEYREYERTLMVCLNAAVAPMLTNYLSSLAENVSALGIKCELHLMKSSGGIMNFKTAQRRAVEAVLSGPAAGALAVNFMGKLSGYENIIGLDMGGTSSDISIVADGRVRMTTDGKIGDYPIKFSIIDITTIGAGGGSIAWLDEALGLHVGPQSAGADPGPACYGKGGEEPTITDANLLLGIIDKDFFLGGEIKLDEDKAKKTISEKIAKPLGMNIYQTAQGILDIAVSNMARAIRIAAEAKGYDLRNFVLLAFGGAGPMHGASLAERLNIPLVVIPPEAGTLSAKGLLVVDVKNDFSITSISRIDETKPEDLAKIFEMLERSAAEEFRKVGISENTPIFSHSLDMRYVGQAYEINIPLQHKSIQLKALEEEFHRTHKALYWWEDRERAVEIVNLRLEAVIEVPKFEPVKKIKKVAKNPSSATPAPTGRLKD